MALASVETLSGYVLEEILAALLRENGYMLLVAKSQDPEALDEDSHGLVVHGRGASHQADALGQLLFSIPFSQPVRLFAEAKCWKTPVGLAEVRNALGVINDVNEWHATDSENYPPLRRFQYRYALFSTSGFWPEAQKFAFAHQISLVDLQGPAFRGLQSAARRTAASMRQLAISADLLTFPLRQARQALRDALDTWSTGEREGRSDRKADYLPWRELEEIAGQLAGELLGRLVLGFPQGPFVLVLRPDSPEGFDAFLARSDSRVDADIHFAAISPERGEWAIVPRADPSMVARFGIPQLLESWLLTEQGIDFGRVEQVKTVLLSYITIFHHGNRLTQLRYNKVSAPGAEVDLFGAGSLDLRRRLMNPGLAFGYEKWSSGDFIYSEPELRVVTAELEMSPRIDEWTRRGIGELLRRLAQRNLLWQVDVIRAAASGADGRISRERVLQLGRKYRRASLNRLIRPIGTVLEELKSEGVVASYAMAPLRPVKKGGRVSLYEVPEEFAELME